MQKIPWVKAATSCRIQENNYGNRTETPANTTMVTCMSYVVTVKSAVKYSFVQKGIEMRQKGQKRAELTLLLVWRQNQW